MTGIIPDRDHDGKADRPKASRAFVEALIDDAGHNDKLALVGRRGYFLDIGKDPAKNDINFYDDACWLLTPSTFLAWNFNTDPSRGTVGQAVLQPGRYLYAVGTHGLSRPKDRQYKALVQASAVTILRVGATVPEVGYFGINIHRGGEFTSTSSEGCQTIFRPEYDEFLAAVEEALRIAQVKTIPYFLTVAPGAV